MYAATREFITSALQDHRNGDSYGLILVAAAAVLLLVSLVLVAVLAATGHAAYAALFLGGIAAVNIPVVVRATLFR